MTRTSTKTTHEPKAPARILGAVLLGLCLCLMALRATYTEAAIAQTFAVSGGISDTVYSLVLSGLLVLALLIWLLWKTFQGALTYRVTGIEIGLAIFALAGIVSTGAATDKRLAITQVMILLGPIAGAMLLVQILDSTARIRVVLLTLAALGIVSAYQCAEQSLSSNRIQVEEYEKDPETFLARQSMTLEPGSLQHFLFEHRLYSKDVRGFFTTSNSAASFVLLASFASLSLLLGRIEEKRSVLDRLRCQPYKAVAVAVIIAGLLLTQSKGGILGFMLAGALFGLWILLRRRLSVYRRTALIVSLASGLVIVSIVGAMIVSYGVKHGRLPGGNSMLVRWQYWEASAQMIDDHPLAGVGPGNFAHNYPRYKPAGALESVADPHCFALSVLAQYGPLGLVGLLAMVLLPICRAAASACPGGMVGASSNDKRLTWAVLGAATASILLLRPFLDPIEVGNADIAVVLYLGIVFYVAPAGAFLIGALLLAHSKHTSRDEEGLDTRIVLAALGCAVLGVLVHNLIDFALFEPGVWTALWMVIACMTATARLQANQGPGTLRATPPVKVLGVIVGLAIVMSYGHYVLGPVYRTTVDIGQAQKAMAVGRFDRAHELLDTAFEADPLSPTPLNINGRLYLQEYEQTGAGQRALLEEAAACFVRATDVNPADYKNYEKAAVAYSLLGQNQEAYHWYLKATERYPGSGRIWLGLAQMADCLGKTDVAVKYYQQAVDIEDAFRAQFRTMYPERDAVVSRLGQENYDLAKKRIMELSI